MTKRKLKNKNKIKHIAYIVLAMIFGSLFGYLGFILLSIKTIDYLVINRFPIEEFKLLGFIFSVLPPYVFWDTLAMGVLIGFYLGRHWWQLVYIEHGHWHWLTKNK